MTVRAAECVERMDQARAELRAAWSQFNEARTPEEVEAACSRIMAAEDRISLIRADLAPVSRRTAFGRLPLPWLRQGRGTLRCAG
ncbi:MAG: hypothetical protein QME79_12430 [Bacillota bacterium]|nr:hypothetical protein [Bacillota bacterium]